MAREMPKSVLDAIDKALPGAVASQLQTYLKTAEINEDRLVNMLAGEMKLLEEISALKQEVNAATKARAEAQVKAADWEERGVDIDAREKAQYKRDCDAKVAMAELKAVQALETRDAVYQLAEKFFANPGTVK